jgi:streptomycin 3"-adenylyltransferase
MLPVRQILDEIVNSYQAVLHENLLGIYLHGSLAMGCFNPYSSDIDFIVIVKHNPDFGNMRKLIDVLLKLSVNGPKKGFEMSVLLEDDAKNFKYPTNFVLHYSETHKDRYIKQSDYICGGFGDPDLAAHIMVLRERGICLIGKPIAEVFQVIPKKYYIESIMNDISSSKEGILNNPIYYILNLCRVFCFLKDGKICSKKEGGEWALINLPVQYTDIVQSALKEYSDINYIIKIKDTRLIDFADFMLKEIKNLCNSTVYINIE